MTTKRQDPVARRTPVDSGLELRISAQPGPVFVQGTNYKISAEVVSGLRQMLTRLVGSSQWPQVVAVTSALREEGVSYTSLAMSAILNQDTGKPVCLVDTNWYWPSVPVVNSAGLAGVLAGTAALDQALVWVADTNLMLLPAGQIPENRRPTAARSAQIVSVIGQLRRHFAYVILDVPAVLATSDAIALTGLADGCCLVVRQGVTPVTTAREALDSIGHLPIMGVIMNRVHLHMPADLAGQLAQA